MYRVKEDSKSKSLKQRKGWVKRKALPFTTDDEVEILQPPDRPTVEIPPAGQTIKSTTSIPEPETKPTRQPKPKPTWQPKPTRPPETPQSLKTSSEESTENQQNDSPSPDTDQYLYYVLGFKLHRNVELEDPIILKWELKNGTLEVNSALLQNEDIKLYEKPNPFPTFDSYKKSKMLEKSNDTLIVNEDKRGQKFLKHCDKVISDPKFCERLAPKRKDSKGSQGNFGARLTANYYIYAFFVAVFVDYFANCMF